MAVAWERASLRRCLTIAIVGIATFPALGAPTILEVLSEGSSPSHGSRGAAVSILATELDSPVRVFFSNGASPSIEATPVTVDYGRGVAVTRVPSNAVTGNLKIRANGVDSALYYIRVDGDAFVPGTRTVTGTVTGGGVGIQGGLAVLLRDPGCEGMQVWDRVKTNASGSYALHMPVGETCNQADDDCDGASDEPCPQLETLTDGAVAPAAPAPTFSWTAGDSGVFVVQFSKTAEPFVVALRSYRGFKPITEWTPGATKWGKIKAKGAGGAPVYWRVIGKPEGSSTKIVSEVFSFTIAP